MYTMMAIANTAVWYIRKLLRDKPLEFSSQREDLSFFSFFSFYCICEDIDVTEPIVIISQYM